MAEETGSKDQAAATTEGSGQQFKIHRIYLKDVSYESPHTPQVTNRRIRLKCLSKTRPGSQTFHCISTLRAQSLKTICMKAY